MAVTNMLIAVALCTLAHSEAFSLRKVAEGLTSRQLRRSDDLVLPTVSPGLNPGDAGVQEWPSEFKPDIMSAFELLKSKRAAAPEEGEGGSQPGPTLPFTSGFSNYFPNISSGNPLDSYNPVAQMSNITSSFTHMPNMNSSIPQMGNLPSGIPQMSNITSGNPIGQYVGGDQFSQFNNMSSFTDQYTGQIPFVSNNNNKPEGDKESKRSADCSS